MRAGSLDGAQDTLPCAAVVIVKPLVLGALQETTIDTRCMVVANLEPSQNPEQSHGSNRSAPQLAGLGLQGCEAAYRDSDSVETALFDPRPVVFGHPLVPVAFETLARVGCFLDDIELGGSGDAFEH